MILVCFVLLSALSCFLIFLWGVNTGSWSQHEISVLLQDLATCVEMFILALFHIFAFEYLTYMDKGLESVSTFESLRPVMRNFASSVSQADLISTVKESYLDRSAGKVARQKKKQSGSSANETTTLVSSEDELPDALMDK